MQMLGLNGTKAIAKGFKLTGKPAQEWINNWVAVLDV